MKRPALLLLAALLACAPRRAPLEQLRADGYRALREGDIEKARSLAEQGRRQAGDAREAAWERTFLVLQAELLAAQRRHAEALAVLEQVGEADAGLTRVRALMTRGMARCLSTRAPEQRAQAEADLEAAAQQAASLSLAELSAEVALRRGSCRVAQGDTAGAETRFRELLGLARREHLALLEAQAAGSLGVLRVRTGRLDDAADWLRRSIDIGSTLQNESLLAKNLINLGWCYYKLGDFERALPLLTRAEAITARRGLAGDRLVALINLGNTRYRSGDAPGAGDEYQRALPLARDLKDEGSTAQLLGNLGQIALELGRHEEAQAPLAEALEIRERTKDQPGRLSSLVNLGHAAAARGAVGLAETYYRQVTASSETEPEQAWEAHAGLAQLFVQAGRAAQAEAQFKKAFASMEQARARLQVAEHKLSFFASLRRFHDAYVDLLIATGRPREALDVADHSRARVMSERLDQPAMGAVTARGPSAALGHSVVLFYWTAPRRSLLWLVTKGGVELRTLPGEDALRKHVDAHQARILRSRDPLEEQAPEAEWLYRTLIGPFEDRIPRGAHVILLPDGPLHRVDFDTLVVPGPEPHYWIEDVTLATAPSLGLLRPAPRRTGAAGGLLAIGDPISPSDEFPPLPFAARELQGIAELFPVSQRTLVSGAAAEPPAYRAAQPERFDYIHFAAHVTANPESPLDSAVILSARDEAYKLYARDIVGLPLRAELVTLSACRSAGSRTYAGEGLVGLAWAFMSTGAQNVVAGLWNVEDASTAELMAELYRGLTSGQSPPTALRNAKLKLMRSPGAHRKPFYWAPFVVYTRGSAAGQSPIK